MEKKNIYLLVGGIALVILSIGVSFAWWGWTSSEDTNVTFTVDGLEIISTDKDISGKLIPTSRDKDGLVEEFTVKQKNDKMNIPVCGNFTLTITNLDDNLKDKSFKYRLIKEEYIYSKEIIIEAAGEKSSCITSLKEKGASEEIATKICNGVSDEDETISGASDVLQELFQTKVLTVRGSKINDAEACKTKLGTLGAGSEESEGFCSNPGFLTYAFVMQMPNELDEMIENNIVADPYINGAGEYNGYNVIGSGNFASNKVGDIITIGEDQAITTTLTKYVLYIWIDGALDNNLNMGNKAFEFKLGINANQQENACSNKQIECDAEEIEPNKPVLAEGMIPIKWNGSNWVKADSTNLNNDWYDYSSKKWANVVMVTSSSRDNYMSAVNGTTINEDDTLAYYVWIPRYKYLLFDGESEHTSAKQICVQYEKTNIIKSDGTVKGQWLTHPAFTFGDAELPGIWVGKFETSGTENTPTIKAGLNSLVSQNVSTQFATSQKFASGTTYLTANGVSKVDAHMMKNTEWGAVAYLKQSKYGLGTTDIGNNAYYSSGYKAGCGPASETDLTSDTTTCTSYTSTAGVKSSTTGNIYGVYDMAGGANEYVMGVMQDNTNTNAPMSGYSTSSNSGFTGKVYDSGNYTSYTGTAFPSSKYYDLYAFGTTSDDSEAYARRILGDATSETRGWYTDYLVFAYAEVPWFLRGGYADSGSEAGVFSAYGYLGGAYRDVSFRSVFALGA